MGIYTDLTVPRMGLLAMIAALDYRARTGKGVHVDLAQYEASLHFLAPAIMRYLATGQEMERQGNRDPLMAPHGIFPCAGDERWIAIAVASDEEWQALRRVMGDPSWTADPRYDTLAGRKEHEDELEAAMSRWTRQHDARELMERLQAEGIAAGVVSNSRDLFNDPQLGHRSHYPQVEHPEMGQHHIEAPEFNLSRTPWQIQRPAPLLGQHTRQVCRDILGLPEEEIQALAAEQVLY
jgi:benzylsuccinate CoA-transferase BbsF subunit